MKKYIIFSIAIAILLGGATIVKAIPLYYLPSSQAGGVASSTASLVVAGGTVTRTFTSDGVEEVAWLLGVGSSTTPPIISWKSEYSNNGTDWYGDSTIFASSTANYWVAATTTPNVTVISNGVDGVTKFVGRKVVISALNTTFTRTTFTVTGTNAMVDIQRALKNQVVTTK